MAHRHLNIWGGSPKGGKSFSAARAQALSQHISLTCFSPYKEIELKGKEQAQPTLYFCSHTTGRQRLRFAHSLPVLRSDSIQSAATQPVSHSHHISINVNSPTASLYYDFTGLTPFITYPIHLKERWGLGCKLQLTKQIYFTILFKKLTKNPQISKCLHLLWESRTIFHLLSLFIPYLKSLLQNTIKESLACLLNKS